MKFLGDTFVVSGGTYPHLDVEPRRYRLRVLNGSPSRFYYLALRNTATNANLPLSVIGSIGELLA